MNDRLPGSCHHNPVWYREKWRIYIGEPEMGRDFAYAYCHDDYDGAPDAHDGRHGFGATVEDCKKEIDELFYDSA